MWPWSGDGRGSAFEQRTGTRVLTAFRHLIAQGRQAPNQHPLTLEQQEEALRIIGEAPKGDHKTTDHRTTD